MPLPIKKREWVRKSIEHLCGFSLWIIVFIYAPLLFFGGALVKDLITVTVIFYCFFIVKRHFFLRASSSQHTVLLNQIEPAITFLLYANYIVTLFYLLGFPLYLFIAAEGIIGIAVAFSIKDVIANLVGFSTILTTRSFSTGECIRSISGFEGVVENIGLYQTRLRTLDRRPLYIPNSIVSAAAIENVGRMYNRHINENFYLVCSDMKKASFILGEIESMLISHEGIDTKLCAQVNAIAFYNNLLKINIYAFTETTDSKEYRRVQQDILLKITKITSPARIIHLQKINEK